MQNLQPPLIATNYRALYYYTWKLLQIHNIKSMRQVPIYTKKQNYID